MYILGISAFYHDSAACLVRDGEILAAAQEERFTRKKHDERFPSNAVEYCLKHAGITIADVDLVAFYDKPLLTFERLLETYIDYAPRGLKSFLKAMPVWLKDKLWTRENIAKALNYEGKILFTEHHESHAASAFFPSPFESAAVVTMDGVGEWATTSYGYGRGNELHLLKELHFPHSIGLLYSAFTYYLGFKVNSGEYKVMGLAPYGEPRYREQILDELVELHEDGSVRLNMKYFNFAAGLTMTNAAFEKLFGEPRRQPESELRQIHLDLARSVQEVTELAMVKIARHVQHETGEKNLCLAGGVALNCVGNGRILRASIFENIWIQPAAGDAGGAVGAALSVWYQYLGNERDAAKSQYLSGRKNYYLGPNFTNDEITDFLDSVGANYQRLPRGAVYETAAAALADEKVVGWFQGRMEFGPRALGGRSILGDARSSRMQSQMNLKIKYRESFRPFAPSILREKVSEFFELETDSPYMLLVAPVRENLRLALTEDEQKLFGIEKLNLRRSTIPAVTHIDYSARIQTVNADESPAYHGLISAFENLTGCPLLVNTSFNVRGEPIVCTPRDAYNCFMKTEMDFLVMEDIILDKRAQNGNLPLLAAVEEEKTSEIEQVTNKQARSTAFVVGAVLFLIGAWNFYRARETAAIIFVGLSAVFVLMGTFLPVAAKFFHVYWMKLARFLGHINSIILLTALFYLVFVPYNLISRIIGRDPLRRRAKRGESNWTKRPATRQSKERFERLF
ncbi:MAG TPA: SxtJ family membrane protein [Pyrinomonadaceae bacterium]|jgi:carbamoyltransferase